MLVKIETKGKMLMQIYNRKARTFIRTQVKVKSEATYFDAFERMLKFPHKRLVNFPNVLIKITTDCNCVLRINAIS